MRPCKVDVQVQANITRKDPKAASMIKMERYLSSDMKPSNRSVRSILERSAVTRSMLKLLGVTGVSLIIAVSASTLFKLRYLHKGIGSCPRRMASSPRLNLSLEQSRVSQETVSSVTWHN